MKLWHRIRQMFNHEKNTTMAQQEVTNFGRFYASFNELPWSGEREDFKKSVVSQYTFGRTEHLHEMTRREYDDCCAGLEKLSGRRDRLKKERSACLKLMQRLGVNTTDWATVDNFCQNPRIAGKRFCHIRLDEFQPLQRKLRAIERKGGFKPRTKEQPQPTVTTVAMMVPLMKGGEA